MMVGCWVVIWSFKWQKFRGALLLKAVVSSASIYVNARVKPSYDAHRNQLWVIP